MSDDYKKDITFTNNQIYYKTLKDINSTLESMGKNIQQCGITICGNYYDNYNDNCKEIEDEQNIIPAAYDLTSISLLNKEQNDIYQQVLQSVLSNKPKCFFVDGPGGTGKTFIYHALLVTLRSQKIIALATASSGVTASNLPGGRTSHTRFKIPIQIDSKIGRAHV